MKKIVKNILLLLCIPFYLSCVNGSSVKESEKAGSDTLCLRFADAHEAVNLILADDTYRRNLSPFDIMVRLEKQSATFEQLDSLAAAGAMEWNDKDKAMILQVAKMFNDTIRRHKLELPFPKEVVIIKTDMKDQGNALGYTRSNWIALSGDALSDISVNKLFELLVHESFHILTRNSIDFKKAIYSTIGFTVVDKELLFPDDLKSVRISNPDVGLYDSYATFLVNGEPRKCAMLLYSSKPYDGGGLFSYVDVGFIPYDDNMVPMTKDGSTLVYSMKEINDFFDKVGNNTGYIIHPEEILAENFVHVISDAVNLKTPQLKEKIKGILKSSK